MSGEMNTSLGNSWANFVLGWCAVFKHGGQYDDWDGVFEGDDAIIGCNVQLDELDFREMGFDVKLIQLEDPMTGSFCGMIVSDDDQCIRDPVKFWQRFGWTNSCIHGGYEVMCQLAKAKSMSALHETPDCPIVSQIAYETYQRTRSSTARFVEDGYHEKITTTDWIRPPNPTPATRILFAEMFGIPSETQIEVEKMISGATAFQVMNVLLTALSFIGLTAAASQNIKTKLVHAKDARCIEILDTLLQPILHDELRDQADYMSRYVEVRG